MINNYKNRGGILGIFLLCFFVVILLSIIFASSSEKKDDISETKKDTVHESVTQKEPAQEIVIAKTVGFSVLEKWNMPNNGLGAKILIKKEYLNGGDMKILGDELVKEYSKYNSAFVQVYTDAQAAKLRDKVMADTTTQSEALLYEKNFVGWYKKNPNSRLHEFDTFINGPMGEHNTISY